MPLPESCHCRNKTGQLGSRLGPEFLHVHRLSRPLGSAIIPTWSHRQGFRISYPVHRLASIHNIRCFFNCSLIPTRRPRRRQRRSARRATSGAGVLLTCLQGPRGARIITASLFHGGQKLDGTILSQNKELVASIFKMISNRPRIKPTHKTIKGNSFHLWQHGLYINRAYGRLPAPGPGFSSDHVPKLGKIPALALLLANI